MKLDDIEKVSALAKRLQDTTEFLDIATYNPSQGTKGVISVGIKRKEPNSASNAGWDRTLIDKPTSASVTVDLLLMVRFVQDEQARIKAEMRKFGVQFPEDQIRAEEIVDRLNKSDVAQGISSIRKDPAAQYPELPKIF